MCVRCVYRMGNARKHTTAARIAARKAEVNGITFIRFLIAFLRRFLDIKHCILRLIAVDPTKITCIQRPGGSRDIYNAFFSVKADKDCFF